MINIRMTKPQNIDSQTNEIVNKFTNLTRGDLIRAGYIYDAKLVDNLSNVIVNVITGRLRASNFVKTVPDRLAIISGVATDYAQEVDDRKNYMDITWSQVENRIDKIMGVNE